MGKYNSTKCEPCKKMVKKRVKERFAEKNPTYWRDWSRRTNERRLPFLAAYGISPEEYREMIEDHGNRCAVCTAKAGGWRANGGRLVVDHDHETGAIRGLLCPSCNRGLGQFEDDPARLISASRYIERGRSLREQQVSNQTKEQTA
jgi:hypothetical protein